MTRFLKYAVEHERKIRAVFLLNGALMQKTVRVLAYDGQTVTFGISARKTVTLPLADVLSCDYARGDDGGA